NDTTATSQTIATTTPPQEKMKTGAIDSLFPATLSWSYPESWSLQSEGHGPHSESDTVIQTITLTSPSKKYQVVYKVGANGGLGGRCDPNDSYMGKIQHISRKPTTNYPGAVFVEFIVDMHSGANGVINFDGYKYTSALYNNVQQVQQAAVGSSVCDLYLKNIFKLSDTYNTQLLSAEILLKDIDTANGTLPKDLNVIKNQYTTAEYQQAVNILLSTQRK
ncbi:MAG TPA: hypothetical protein VIQ80_01690, partial [Candidatus Saccharimonadales bacterium]